MQRIGVNMNQNKAPLFEALLAHSKSGSISFHVPGHKKWNCFSSWGLMYIANNCHIRCNGVKWIR
ncbi:hypothetical protein KHA80_10245 [Anaerobacillus sp. HL2]|nr:hypothetical protein KHA80_10245 [Anaerobacillus sp. HL2]